MSMGVLQGKHGQTQGATRLWRPAAAHIVNAPEACLVWKHQPDGFASRFFVEAVERFVRLFFSLFLSHSITFWMALVRGRFPPIMALQQHANRRPSQRIIKVMLELSDHNVASLAELLQTRLECSSFFFQCEVLSAPPPRAGMVLSRAAFR